MSEEKKANAVKMKEADNVATAVVDLQKGTLGVIKWEGVTIEVTLSQDIPFGHKFALIDIEEQSAVIKYGEQIGLATRAISKGAHVHVHNVDSVRGKGEGGTEREATI